MNDVNDEIRHTLDQLSQLMLSDSDVDTMEILKSYTLNDIFLSIKKETNKMINHAEKDLFRSNSIYKTKYEIYSSISRKIKAKLNDKSITPTFLNYIIGSRIEGVYERTRINTDVVTPISALEILNDIFYFYHIKKTYSFYSPKTMRDLITRNMKLGREFIVSEKLQKYYFDYLIINLDVEDDFEKLLYEIEGSRLMRRPVDNEYGYYRYIPITCDRYCIKNFNNFKNEWEIFIGKIRRQGRLRDYSPYDLETNEQFANLIKNIFLKNCIFSHNPNEVNYHPFKFMTRYCKNDSRCNMSDCINAHQSKNEEIVLNFNPDEFSDIIKELEQMISKFNEEEKRKISEQVKNQIMKSVNKVADDENSLFNILKFKTLPCTNGKLCVNMKECSDYHSSLERRRNPETFLISNNKACPKVFIEGKWTSPSQCEAGDACSHFHTRNELFYDFRNFRRIYECPFEKNEGKCKNNNTCAYKHFLDINFEELYLPNINKAEIKDLINQFNFLKDERDKLTKRLHELGILCPNCKEYIVDKMIVLQCGHNYCFDCRHKIRNCSYSCKLEENGNSLSSMRYEIIELQKKKKEEDVDSMLGFYNEEEKKDEFININDSFDNIFDDKEDKMSILLEGAEDNFEIIDKDDAF